MFRRILGGETLSEAQMQDIQSEDDSGVIVLDGKETNVEFWSLKKIWKKNVEEPFKKHVLEPIKKHVEEPLKELGKDVVAIGKDLAKFSVELPGKVLMGTGRVTRGLFDGGLKGGWDALRTEAREITSFVSHQVVDTGVMALHSAVNTIEGVLGTMEERNLTSDEIDSLKLIYGDAIDYSEVRVQTGGIKNTLFKGSANVVGNDIFMSDKFLDGNGGFTPKGQEVLMHELGHVWQYQNHGPEYLSEAIQAQHNEGDGHVGTGEAYDWLHAAQNGLNFNEMNPESQAELAMFIGLSIPKGETEIDRTQLETVIRKKIKDTTYQLPDHVFTIADEAHDILRGIPHVAFVSNTTSSTSPATAETPHW